MMNDIWNVADWERIWFRAHSRPWRTLAIVPTERDSCEPAYQLVTTMVALAAQHDEELRLADFRNVPLFRVSTFLQITDEHVSEGGRLVYATRSIDENPATVRVARSADCVLLCVSMGTTAIRTIEDVIDQIGRPRFLGSVVFRKPKASKGQPGLVLRHDTIDVGR